MVYNLLKLTAAPVRWSVDAAWPLWLTTLTQNISFSKDSGSSATTKTYVHRYKQHCQLAASAHSCARRARAHTHTHPHTQAFKYTQWTAPNRETNVGELLWGTLADNKVVLHLTWWIFKTALNKWSWTSILCGAAAVKHSWVFFHHSSVGGLRFQALIPCFTNWASIHCCEHELVRATRVMGLLYSMSAPVKGLALNAQDVANIWRESVGRSLNSWNM